MLRSLRCHSGFAAGSRAHRGGLWHQFTGARRVRAIRLVGARGQRAGPRRRQQHFQYPVHPRTARAHRAARCASSVDPVGSPPAGWHFVSVVGAGVGHDPADDIKVSPTRVRVACSCAARDPCPAMTAFSRNCVSPRNVTARASWPAPGGWPRESADAAAIPPRCGRRP